MSTQTYMESMIINHKKSQKEMNCIGRMNRLCDSIGKLSLVDSSYLLTNSQIHCSFDITNYIFYTFEWP